MRLLLVTLGVAALAACGSNSGGSGDGGPDVDDGGTPLDDGGNPIHPDGSIPPDCVPGGSECSDCIDNDHDGDIDGFDIECTGAIDDDEGSFGTGIPGDNMDLVNQDCFFDGNSGAGDDRCNRHVCCMLGLDAQECDDGGYDGNYDPVADCPVQDQDCIDNCGALTPPGCDCFGCCTVCDDDGCVDIYLNPSVAPNCDETLIHDATACPVCTPAAECGTDCPVVLDDCILCPGEDPSTLPETCVAQECPAGEQVCAGSSECPDGQFCASGCCIFIVN